MFQKILIANRGEIACRVIATARRLGIATVAVYSDADRNARHVRLADEAVWIGPPPARESYLDIERILEAARRTGAQAIHPGYGFLSENEAFAQACLDAGIVFIGPPVEAIRKMGSKAEAKRLMEAAGVPLTPGYHGEEQGPAYLFEQAMRIGFPVLIKASAGGGGKGMRRVDRPEDFAEALESCRREARSSFGDDRVLIEKYILRPRHIEMQVFGDTHGQVIHLYERDCSVQRRHQKVLEEAPAPGMTPERRAAMGEAAVAAAKAVGYVNAGTIEFIVEPSGAFYFMEMNTRLQVEHPVTEMITGLDLVEWQLRVAAGEPLPLTQDQIPLEGHAIEARIYAEDPAKGFLPSVGRLVHLQPPPESVWVRVDTGVEQGDEITPYYDPMIAKLIVWGENRAQALTRMRQALANYRIVGVANNVEFLGKLVDSPAFRQADLDTGLIERESAFLFGGAEEPPPAAWFAVSCAERLAEARRMQEFARRAPDPTSPWHAVDGWRVNAPALRRWQWRVGETTRRVQARCLGEKLQLQLFDEKGNSVASATAWGAMLGEDSLRLELDGRRTTVTAVTAGSRRHVFLDGRAWVFDLCGQEGTEGSGTGVDAAGLTAPMPGRVIAVKVEPGAKVARGQTLVVLEAMKMEHAIVAPADGIVKAVRFAVGEQVPDGAELVDFEPVKEEA
jgi:3-methylcrotonyl-CoA carboxylase alpha subunit